MKKAAIMICSFMLLMSCKNGASEKETTASDCPNFGEFGDTRFCLPQIDGLIESYQVPEIKQKMSYQVDEHNTILGYYLPTAVYEIIKNGKDTLFDNYYKVYSTNQTLNYNMTPFEMTEVMRAMTAGMQPIALNEVSEKLQDTTQMARTTPLLVDQFVPQENTKTAVAVMPSSQGSANAVSISAVLVKERLVFVAHYLSYTNEATIKVLKANTTSFLDTFIAANHNN